LFGGAAIPSEVYIFDGDIYRTDGSIGELRGYAERDGSAVENIWYARRGRVPAMRAALRSFGFGHKSYTSVQNGAFAPPFPILNNRFIGVAVLLAAQPAIAARSVWPNDGNEDVRPYGLDTDLSGPNQYSGPPIHVTLPVDEPFLRNTGVTQLNLTKVASNGGAPIATTVVPGGNQFRVYSNVSGLVVPSIAGVGQYAPIGPIAPSLTNVRVTAISGLFTSGTPPAQPATSPLVFLLQGVDGWR
jgi:hypothetical protein